MRKFINALAVLRQWVQCPVCHKQWSNDAEAAACAFSHNQ